MRNIHKLFNAVVFVFGMLLFVGNLAYGQIVVSVDNISGQVGVNKLVPIKTTTLTGQSVYSVTFTITYDKTVVNIAGVSTAGTMLDAYKNNLQVNTSVAGQITVVASGSSALVGAGTLINLNVAPIIVGNSPITLSNFMFNEGTPAAGTLTSRIFTVPSLSLTVPDVTLQATIGGAISVPVTIDDLTGKGVYGYKFTVAFDSTKIKLTGYTKVGTLSAAWSNFQINTSVPGKLTIVAAGSSVLVGKGTIVYLTGTAVSASTSLVTFSDVLFNEGTPGVGSVDGTVTIVANVKPAFTKALSDISVAETQTLSYTYTAVDPNGDVVKYSLVGVVPAGAKIDSLTGVFSWTPGYKTVGAYTISVKATDPSGLFDSTGAKVTVTLTNVKPAFTKVPNDTTALQNVALALAYTAVDPNGDVVKYSLTGTVPTGAKIDSLTGAFTWTPSYTQSGAFTFIVKAADPLGLFSLDTVKVTVTVVNVKPAFTKVMNDTTILENATLTYTYAATDVNSDVVKYSLVGTIANAKIDSLTGVFTFAPNYTQSGVYSVIVKAADPLGLFNLDTAKVTVTDVNRKPVLAVKAPTQKIDTVTAATNIYFKTTATDPDGDAITYTWKLNGVQIKSGADSTYTGNFPTIGTSQYVVCIFADTKGGSDSATWSFKVVKLSTGVVDQFTGVPTEFMVGQNYPNPFNPSTTIKFGLPKAAPVTLEIYNIVGAKVRTLLSGSMMDASFHNVVWDGRSDAGTQVASGMYLYRLVAGTHVSTMKMLLMK